MQPAAVFGGLSEFFGRAISITTVKAVRQLVHAFWERA
jgi:hypothetical protein